MEKIIIAAVAENGVIGKDGEIPWHIPEDMQHFKEKTVGNTVIMGRKTFESLPSGFKPLPDRENIVLTRSGFSPKDESVKVANNLEEAWSKAGNQKVFIIGGARIYEQTLEEADKMIITEVHGDYEGDTFFPEWNRDEWEEVERNEKEEISFVEYLKSR